MAGSGFGARLTNTLQYPLDNGLHSTVVYAQGFTFGSRRAGCSRESHKLIESSSILATAPNSVGPMALNAVGICYRAESNLALSTSGRSTGSQPVGVGSVPARATIYICPIGGTVDTLGLEPSIRMGVRVRILHGVPFVQGNPLVRVAGCKPVASAVGVRLPSLGPYQAVVQLVEC